MKLFGTILASAVLALTVTSCNTDGESTNTQNVSVLNIIETGGTQKLEVATAQFVLSTGTDADQFALGVDGAVWRFSNLRRTMSQEGYTWKETATTQLTGCPTMPSPFTVKMLGVAGNTYYNLGFVDRTITGIALATGYVSQTTVMEAETGRQVLYTSDLNKNQFIVEMNAEDIKKNQCTLNLHIGGASFIEGMPAMNMRFKSIPFKIYGNMLSFEKTSLTPELSSGGGFTPQERFPISDLKASGVLGGPINLGFCCTYKDKNGVETKYRVSSRLLGVLPQSSGSN